MGQYFSHHLARLKQVIQPILILCLAGICILWSYLVNSFPLTLLGLGLIIWGTMLFLTKQKTVNVDLVFPTMAELVLSYNSLLDRFGFKGKAEMWPPTTIGENPTLRFISNDQNARISPLGLDLMYKIEMRSPVDIFNLDFDTFSSYLTKMFTDELRLVSGFEMAIEGEMVHLKLFDFLYHELCVQLDASNPNICMNQLCPVCSTLACLISKATRKKVTFEKKVLHRAMIEIWFRIFD